MATGKCQACHEEISLVTRECPYCGAKTALDLINKTDLCLFALIVAIYLAILTFLD